LQKIYRPPAERTAARRFPEPSLGTIMDRGDRGSAADGDQTSVQITDDFAIGKYPSMGGIFPSFSQFLSED
jgi:hypothetical protein